MSDGKEVKRRTLEQIMSKHLEPDRPLMGPWVEESDHDRVVAELRAEVKRTKRFEAALEDAVIKYRETIARQERVIEIATRTMATVLELEHCGRTSCPRPTRAMCSNESHKVLRSALKEIAAIERGES